MKSENIVKKLEKEGYKIIYKKWGYWDGVPHIQLDGFDFAIAEFTHKSGWMGINLDFIYNQVRHALSLAKVNNPIILKKIEQVPWERGYYGRYLIRDMENYYLYKKEKYPFDNYYQILEKLKKEFK